MSNFLSELPEPHDSRAEAVRLALFKISSFRVFTPMVDEWYIARGQVAPSLGAVIGLGGAAVESRGGYYANTRFPLRTRIL